MALTRNAAGVIIFSWTAGIMYSTLFTMPYLLVANYHASQVVQSFLFLLLYFFSLYSYFNSNSFPRIRMVKDSPQLNHVDWGRT